MPEDPKPPQLLKEVVPQDLHGKGYWGGLLDKPVTDALPEVIKKLDGAETLIGRKIGIPAEDAKDEEVAKFYDTLAPKADADYEFKLGEKPDEKFVGALRKAFHAGRLSKRQAAKFVEAISPFLEESAKAQKDALAKMDTEFEASVKDVFKDDAKGLDRAKAVIAKYGPENLRGHVNQLDDKSVVLLAGIADSIAKQFLPEDDYKALEGSGAGGGGGTGGTTKKELLDEAEKIFASDAWKDPTHKDHESVVKRKNEIFAHSSFAS